MTPDNAFATLLEETRSLIAVRRDLIGFAGQTLDGLALVPPRPRDLPVTAGLVELMAMAAPETAALTFAILAAAPHLVWQQSYSEEEVGAHYLANYGWFNLIAPDGPYVAQGLRISVGVWGRGLTYPRHWHAPEEIYCVLAGGARFHAEGRAPREVGPGETVHHPSNLPHSMEMHSAPMMAMALWKGDGLSDKPGIEVP